MWLNKFVYLWAKTKSHSANVKALLFTSSHEDEIASTEFSLIFISINANSAHTSRCMCTDNQSLWDILSSCNARIDFIRHSKSSILSTTFIQWVPGHSRSPGNDAADRATKKPPHLHLTPSTFHLYHTLFRSSIKFSLKEPPSHVKINKIYHHHKISTDVKHKKLQGWSTEYLTPLWAQPISKSTVPLNRISYWSVTSILLTSGPHIASSAN